MNCILRQNKEITVILEKKDRTCENEPAEAKDGVIEYSLEITCFFFIIHGAELLFKFFLFEPLLIPIQEACDEEWPYYIE